MMRAARLVWMLGAGALLIWASCALAVDVEPRKMWDGIHPLEVRPYRIEEDYGQQPMYDMAIQYYYYLPCPTYSWFWGYSGWEPGDVLGASFTVGDQPSGPFDPG